MTSSPLSSAPATSTEASPREVYRERLDARSRQLSELDTRRHRCGLFRLLVFALAGATVWFAIQGKSPSWAIGIPVAAFIALVWWQSRIEREMECARRAIGFYERGIARIEHRWQGGGETGERFLDAHHPYSLDLDIFGRGSLFELLSTARTRGGEAKLAEWLRAGDEPAELRQRHKAIEELTPLLDLREQLAVLGSDFRVGVNPEHLSLWAVAPLDVFAPSLHWGAFILSILMAVALLWWFATQFIGIEATRVVVAIGAVVGALGLSLRKRVLGIAAGIHEPAHDLELLAQMPRFAGTAIIPVRQARRAGSSHQDRQRTRGLRPDRAFASLDGTHGFPGQFLRADRRAAAAVDNAVSHGN